MVRRRVAQHTLGLKGTRGSGVHLGTWGNIELLKETKTEHEKLHRNGNCDSGHVYVGDAVVPTLHTSTRVRGRVRRIVSRQYQLAATYKELHDVEREKDKTHQGKVLLHKVQS